MSRLDANRITLVEDQTLWKGWSHLRRLVFEVTRPDGATDRLSWEVFDRGHAVAILLQDLDRDTVLLVRQFRLPAYLAGDHAHLLEVPAGMADGEAPDVAVRREVLEETGYRIDPPRRLFSAYMSPGAVTEKIHFFHATIRADQKVAAGGGLAEEHEDLELVDMPLTEALALIDSGGIVDAKTILLLQWAALNRRT